MKRFMVFIMVFVMIFCLTGCTGDPDIGTSGPDGTTASEPSGTEESDQPAFVFPAGSAGTDEEIAGWEIQDSVNLTESLNIPLWTKQWYSKNKKLTDVCCATNGLGETYCVIRARGGGIRVYALSANRGGMGSARFRCVLFCFTDIRISF